MSHASHFADRLVERILRIKSRVCVGCDPDPALFPPELAEKEDAIAATAEFGFELIAAVREVATAVKFQAAFYERLGPGGLEVLARHLAAAREAGLPAILDGKRGDVAHTTRAYADAYLTPGAPLEADAVTVSPYLGRDTLTAFADVAAAHGKGLFVLVKTSNPSTADVQDVRTEDGRAVYHRVAEMTAAVGRHLVGESGYSAAGAVVGATYPDVVARLRELMPQQFFLMPGVGAQGGDVALLGPAFDTRGLGALVSSSRGVAYAWRERKGLSWQKAARAAARELRRAVNEALPIW